MGLTAMAVAQPTLTASLVDSGTTNRTVSVRGESFPANTDVRLEAAFGPNVTKQQAVADGSGSFASSIPVPAGYSGVATITARTKRPFIDATAKENAKAKTAESQTTPLPTTTVTPAETGDSNQAAAPTPATNTSPTAITTLTPTTFPTTVTTPTSAGAGGKIYGFTLDDISGIDEAVTTISGLPSKPAVRVVFDEGQDPSYYAEAINKLQGKAVILGEILDSFYVKDVSVGEYEQRTSAYVAAFGEKVDYWEIGNEINGEWLGTTPDVVAKLNGAHEIVKQAGLKTAITLYYNQDCWADRANEMLPWTKANINASVSGATDMVLISYYEDDCNGLILDDWNPVFRELEGQFPKAQLGFGEVGIPKPVTSGTKAHADDVMKRYFTMNISSPRYIGGFYWWNGSTDIATGPKTMLSLFTELSSA